MDKQMVKIIFLSVVAGSIFLFSGCGQKNITGQKDGNTYFEPVRNQDQGYISYGHSKYQFQLYFPAFLIEGEMTPTVMGSFQFPESYTTGTNLLESYIFINRKARTCEDLGYGLSVKPSWHNGKTAFLNQVFTEKIFVGGVEFNKMFCSGFQDNVYIDALVYTTERMNEPVSLSLVLVSQEPSADLKIFNPSEFEEEYIKVLKTYINNNDNIEQ